jgi:hypothetical protein
MGYTNRIKCCLFIKLKKILSNKYLSEGYKIFCAELLALYFRNITPLAGVLRT